MRSLQSDLNSSGKIINLLTTDCSRFEIAIANSGHLFVGPIYSIGIVLLLFNVANYTMLTGLVIILLSIPIQSLLGRILGNFRYFILLFQNIGKKV